MRMIQLSSDHQTPNNNKSPKPTKEQLQNEFNFHLAEKILIKLLENNLITEEEFNLISELNHEKFNPLLGPLICDKP